MSKGKKLDLSLEKLIEIANELNKNIIANKKRSKDEKIGTDKFIRNKFGINRKNFSATIRDTDIKYNKSTFLYDIPEEIDVKPKSETRVVKSETTEIPVNKGNNKGEIIVSHRGETFVSSSETNLVEFDNRLKNIEDIRNEIDEMLKWYREQRYKENIIDIEIPEIRIDSNRLQEKPITRGFKIYPSVVAEFKEFCKKNSQYTMQDLLAMAMIEFMERYSKQ